MDHNEGFLRAIREDFDDDTPRLVYADWLEEHATTAAQTAQAEFIRVQIELAGMPELVDRTLLPRWRYLFQRQNALLELHRQDWLEQGTPGRFPPGNVTFHRGFASEGEFPFEGLRPSATAVLSHPLLRSLTVSGIDDQNLPDLLACPWLRELRGLTIQPGSGDWPQGRPIPTDWERLADADCFGELASLCLWGTGVLTRRGAARLAENPTLAGVRHFQFLVPARTHPIPDLLNGPAFRALSSLHLQAHELPAPPPPDVFTNPRLSCVEKLTLQGYFWDRPTVERMTRAPFWNGVREITLGEGGMSADALSALGDTPAESLRKLCLIQNLPADLSGLCGPVLRSIHSLHLLTGLAIDRSLVERLANCEHALGLRSLSLSSRSVGDAEVAVLAASPRFSGLYRLDLMRSGVTSIGAMALAASPHLDNLTSLVLFGCRLDERAKAALRDRFGEAVWLD